MGFKNRSYNYYIKTYCGVGSAVLISAVCMFYLTFFLLDRVVLYGDDSTITIQAYSLLKTVITGDSSSPPKNSILLINTAYDNQLVDIYDPVTGPGNRAITDRLKLKKLFRILNNNKVDYRYLVCDIFFEDELPGDIALAKEMEKMKLVIPYFLDKNKVAKYPNPAFRQVNMGLAQYDGSEGLFVKFRYGVHDHKSIPVKMYEDIHGKKYSYKDGEYKRDGDRVLNNTVLDFRVRHYDIFETKKYQLINLGSLLQLPDVVESYLSNKIILIGNFVSDDIHETVIGEMSGSLLLLNAYYALVEGDNILHWGFGPFLFLGYLCLSIMIFLPISVKNSLCEKCIPIFLYDIKNDIESKKSLKVVWPIVGYIKLWVFTDLLALLIISTLSYLLFGIHVNILYLSMLVISLEYGVRIYYERSQNPGQEDSSIKSSIEKA